jgi:glycosyltransferase involved in cell wall biosynthesis
VRVLVITVVHTPTDARIYHRQIRALLTAGHHVTFVAPFDGYGLDAATFSFTGRLKVVDVMRATGRQRLNALRHARRLLRQLAGQHDVVLIHDPELLAVATRRVLKNTPLVYDVHEHAAAALTERTYLPPLVRRIAARVVTRLEKRAEKRHSLILAEPAYQQRFRRKHAVVENVPWAAKNPPAAATTNTVVYLGRISVLRGAHEMLALGEKLAAVNGPVVTLIGPVDDELKDTVQDAHAAGTINWLGPLPNDVALTTMAGAYAGLSLLHDTANYRVSRPTKLLEYFAHRLPIITTGLPEATRLTGKANSGTVVPFGQAGSTAAFDTIMGYVNDPAKAVTDGDAGYRWVIAHATFDRQADTFVNVLKKACR